MAPLGCVDADGAPRPDVGVVMADAGVPPVGVFIFTFIGEGRGRIVMLNAAAADAVAFAAAVGAAVGAEGGDDDDEGVMVIDDS